VAEWQTQRIQKPSVKEGSRAIAQDSPASANEAQRSPAASRGVQPSSAATQTDDDIQRELDEAEARARELRERLAERRREGDSRVAYLSDRRRGQR
jgi:hypothetical protein